MTSLLPIFANRDHFETLPQHVRQQLASGVVGSPAGLLPEQLSTPMMKQFAQAKNQAPDALLFFRMGDFFEVFGHDAYVVSHICQLTLTSRDKTSANPVPMAGVPVVTYVNAVRKCVQAGYKVAICDQVEEPKNGTTLVRREIVRMATPAVPGDWDEEISPLGCYLAALWPCDKASSWTLAVTDASTGEFKIVGALDDDLFIQEFLTFDPKEVIVPQNVLPILKQKFQNFLPPGLRFYTAEHWISSRTAQCEMVFAEFFKPSEFYTFGLDTIPNALQTVTALLCYLKVTQKLALENIKIIQSYTLSNHCLLDESTRRHLEIFQTASHERRGSLMDLLNKTQTPYGARALSRRLLRPFKNVEDIQYSLDCVSELLKNSGFRWVITQRLGNTGDMERILAQAAQKTMTPKLYGVLRDTLVHVSLLMDVALQQPASSLFYQSATDHLQPLQAISTLKQLLEKALLPTPSPVLGKGDIFVTGFHEPLDVCCHLQQNIDGLMSALEQKERNTTKISTLKIGYNRVFGYYFEISKGKINQIPQHFHRKQTLTNADRFITEELKSLEERFLSASEERSTLERQLLEQLRQQVLSQAEPLTRLANLLAQWDVYSTFANLAEQNQWTEPVLTHNPVTALKQCLHPVLSSLRTLGQERFVPNDIVVGLTSGLPEGHFGHHLPDAQVLLITGPNMAGKSTIMRQLAIAQLMCQIGCFVPAQEALIGVCDRMCTRIGSADNPLKNQSTFMVEMLETARVLKQATDQSLLLMDEIGRGTSTADGVSLAWAILEDIHDRIRARTLFSTHYHELLKVAATHSRVRCMHMEVVEKPATLLQNMSLFFSRRFIEGGVGKSYGLHVAEMAGLPPSVVNRAQVILRNLEM